MNRRNFISGLTLGSGAIAISPLMGMSADKNIPQKISASENDRMISADVIIAGGGLGGCAAAFAALRNGLTVVMTEETDWIGGQLTQQGVPPDEHQWIETHGATALYRNFRTGIRDYYKNHYPLTAEASSNEFLNPGDGAVSRLCHEPKVALRVLQNMFAPYESAGKLLILLHHKITSAAIKGNRVQALNAKSLFSDVNKQLTAPYFVDATELGDLLPLTKTDYITGTESRFQTGELHAPEVGNPNNNQAFTVCFAMDYVKGEDWTIPKPEQYDFWKNYVPDLTPPWPGKILSMYYSNPQTLEPKKLGFHPEGLPIAGLLNLWNYRRIIHKNLGSRWNIVGSRI